MRPLEQPPQETIEKITAEELRRTFPTTCSLSLALVEGNFRMNEVVPGPIWTPLIPSTFPEEAYMTGQVLHRNGGTVVNG